MDLRKKRITVLSAAAALCLSTAAAAAPTVWLVRPLYPGQEALIERTEAALSKLMPGDARREAIIGRKELAAALAGRGGDALPCFSGDERCADPIDRFVAQLGFERVVLIEGGQDETGFKYRVVAYEPATGKTRPASATNTELERALLGAVSKVVPAASTLKVTSTPSGATVFVDDVKVGVTPLDTLVLAGEHRVRVDLKLHQPIEDTIIVPIRGEASLDKKLEKVAARIIITASPAGADISIDGVSLGKDKVDRGIEPGTHVVRITLDKHKSFEQSVTVKADEQYVLDKSLESTEGPKVVVVERAGTPGPGQTVAPATPPPPPTETELSYGYKSYVTLALNYDNLLDSNLVGARFDKGGFGRTTNLTTPSRGLMGVALDYGSWGKYFGLGIVGLTFHTNFDRYGVNVGHKHGSEQEKKDGVVGPDHIDSVRAYLGTIRLIQPGLRLCVWRFQFSLQLGLAVNVGLINDDADEPFYDIGFVVTDLVAEAHLAVRFNIGGGFFAFGQGNYSQYILGWTSTAADDTGNYTGSSMAGFNVGVGYGF